MDKKISRNLIVLISAVMIILQGCQNSKEEQMRHIVIFKFKPTATTEQISMVTDAFRELKNEIPGIVAFEYGINDSPENKNLDFTHVYQMTFEDASARDEYLPHPAHKEFGQMLGEMNILEDAFVVDYVPQK